MGTQTLTGVRAVGLVALATMAACVDHDELALCPAFVEYVVVYDALAATDPSGATAAAAAEAIDVVIGEVRQLRSVAGQRYRTPIDRLEDVLEDLDRTLTSFDEGDEYERWEPLVNDTIDDLRVADDRVRAVIRPTCLAQAGAGSPIGSDDESGDA